MKLVLSFLFFSIGGGSSLSMIVEKEKSESDISRFLCYPMFQVSIYPKKRNIIAYHILPGILGTCTLDW